MRIQWNAPDTSPARCPVCGCHAAMSERLRILDWRPNSSPLVLLICPDCGSWFFPGLAVSQFHDLGDSFARTWCERAIGLAPSIEPLTFIADDRVGSMLDVGCGLGWSLDFAKWTRGWRVNGVDASELSEVGRSTLGLPIASELASVAGAPFDLVYASDVLEHVERPREFVNSLRPLMRPGGLMLLRTPNAAAVSRDAPRALLRPLLNPGNHAVLYHRTSAERLLRQSGFRYVETREAGASLDVMASDDPIVWPPCPIVSSAEICRYLRERPIALSMNSAVRTGFHNALLTRMMAAGDLNGAREAYTTLRESLLDRAGVDSDRPDDVLCALESGDGETPRFSGGLADALFGRGWLAMHAENDRGLAGRFFAAAAAVARAARSRLEPQFDLGLSGLVREAELHAAACVSTTEASVLLRAALPTTGGFEIGDWLVALTELVALGSLATAATLADEVEAKLASLRPEDIGMTAIEAAYSLAMLRLHHHHAPDRAARGFATVQRWLALVHRTPSGGTASPRFWDARFHEGYAHLQAGALADAREALESVMIGGGAPQALRDQARSILAKLAMPSSTS